MTWQPQAQRPLPGTDSAPCSKAEAARQEQEGGSGLSAHDCPCLGAAKQDSGLKAGEVVLPGRARGTQP